MEYIKFSLLSAILLAGCTFNQHQGDVAENQYYDKQIHADPSAAYIGEWTAATNVGLRSIKIKEDGRIKVCLSPSSGTTDGEVYLEKGKPAFILKTGEKANIISIDKDFLLLDVYGKREKYYAGQAPDTCKSTFINFK